MNTRALLAALLFGGAVLGTRVLPGLAMTQQPAASPNPPADPTPCIAANGTESRHRQKGPAGTESGAARTSCPRPAMLALGSG